MFNPMMLVGSFLLLLLSGGQNSELQPDENISYNYTSKEKTTENETKPNEHCNDQGVINYLNLIKNKDLFTMSRPVRHHTTVTNVSHEMLLIGVLDVREVSQLLVSQVDIYLGWDNEYIRWDPAEFCGLSCIKVSTELMWRPDLIIQEVVEQDKTPVSPYLEINFDGFVVYRSNQVVISTCKMHVYRFPFDVQHCNFSFRSIVYDDNELKLYYITDKTILTQWSRIIMHTQYEWLFLEMTVSNKTDIFYINANQTTITYTIHMKRKSVLYIANFLVPILFFLCLDLSSFLISDSGGEKLSFKVTVMLAITVMQLILNDILPSSSDRIPLIVVFCIGIFALMMLSLLETILVMYLLEKDVASQNKRTRDLTLNMGRQSCFKELKECANCASVTDVTPSSPNEVGSSQLVDLSLASEKVSADLEQTGETVTAASGENQEKSSDGWTAVTKQINKAFLTFYVTAASVFLAVVFSLWTNSDEDE